ncbi:hypothetical protein [Streptomyces syringium]|uniref:hypothetical protein n=1 Tax=Streptomyces syringium TaxID=76729 RepID=UPI0037CCCF8E
MEEIIAWVQWIFGLGGALIALGGTGRAFARRVAGQEVHPAEVIFPVVGGAMFAAVPQVVRWLYGAADSDSGQRKPEHHQDLPDMPWGTILLIVGAVLGVVAAVAVATAGTKAVKRGRKRRRTELARRRAVEARHDVVLEAYGAYESDILSVLERPALADVTIPATEKLIHALTEAADARQTDRTTMDGAAVYQRAVTALEIAWKAADEHARRAGVEHLPPAEQKAVTQARKLLASALHDGGGEHERRLAYQHAMRLIDGAVSVPRQATAALEHISRPSLMKNPE